MVTEYLKNQSEVALPTADLFPKLDNEMSTYIVKRTPTGLLTYSHETGLHDDSVDSFLIANHARVKALSPGGIYDEDRYEEEEMEDSWTDVYDE